MKKLLAILFAAVLCLALGVTAWAYTGSASDVFVAGIELSDGNYLDENRTKGTTALTDNYAYLHVENNKSILTLYNYDCTVDGQDYYCVSWEGDLTIELPANTESTVINKNTNAGTSGRDSDKTVAIQGINNNNTLTIKGSGTLNATGYMHAIWAWSNITIEDGATVNAEAEIPANGTDAENSIALSTNNGGSVTINGATVTATGNVYGIGSSNSENCPVSVTGNSNVTVKGGTKAIRGTVTIDEGLAAKASTEFNGTLGTYEAAELGTYKYVKIEKAAPTYTVTYNINGGEGTVPTDDNSYASGAEVTVKSGEGLTIADEYKIFVGWNTEIDGSGKSYEAGEKITVEDNDIVLYAEWDAKVEIGGVAVTSSNKSGEGWSYDLATKTLTLEDYDEGSIKSEIDLNIVLNGENKVESGKRKAIEVNGNLKISGNGKLTATGDDVDATGSNKQHSVGIYAYGNIDIVSGTIIANGGDVERTDSNSYGIRSENGNITISGNANVTAAGGDATNNSNGIRAKGDVVISGYAIVKASGGAAKGCYGFRVDGNITVSENANVTAVGKLGGGSLNNLTICGIRATKLTISGKGSVDAAIGDAPSGKAFDLGSLELPEKYEYRTVSGAEYTSGEKTPFVLADNAAKIYIKIKGTEASTSGEDENPNPNPDPKPDPDPKPETKPEACDHKFDANGKCSRCGVIVISYPRDEAEANPNTGAPVVNGFAAIAVLAAGAICLGKRK